MQEGRDGYTSDMYACGISVTISAESELHKEACERFSQKYLKNIDLAEKFDKIVEIEKLDRQIRQGVAFATCLRIGRQIVFIYRTVAGFLFCLKSC